MKRIMGAMAQTFGGGTAQLPNGEIASCDIELSIEGDLEEDIEKIKGIIESMLAPKGSQLII